MDVVQTLNFFDRWFASHKKSCGVARLDVSVERDVENTGVKLGCPMCGNTIKGTISDTDWPHVIALLNEEKQS